MREINGIVIHCSDSPWGDAAIIREWHMARDFSDIGYHAVILNGFRRNSRNYQADADGLLEPGRSVDKSGAHAKRRNKDTLGICLIGKDEFTPAQFATLEELVQVWRRLHRVPVARIVGHRDLDPSKTCPNFDVAEWLLGRIG